MNKKSLKARSCAGKVRHSCKQNAVVALKKVGNDGLSAYQCKFCQGWHLGTQRKKFEKRMDQLIGPDPNLKWSQPIQKPDNHYPNNQP